MKRRRIFLFLYSMSDSGTSQEMAEKLHSPSVLCDLNPHPSKRIGNWNALKDKVGHSADLIFFHLPYHDIIQYSGNMWGRPHEDDLGSCGNYEDCIEKMNCVIKKLYFSLRQNRYLAILLGDIQQKGVFHFIAADMFRIGNMKSWIVKRQFHCISSKIQYSGKPFILIVAEPLVLFQKEEIFLVPFSIRKIRNIPDTRTGFHFIDVALFITDDNGTVKWTCNVKATVSGIKRVPKSQEE